MMPLRKFIFLIALLFVSPVFAVFSGDDDGFHTTGTVTATDTAVSNVCTVEMEDYQGTSGATNIGSFDDSDNTETSRTPIRLNIIGDLSAGVGTDNAWCIVRIYRDQTCGGTLLKEELFNLALQDAQQSVNRDITPANFNGYGGELCIRLVANISDGVGSGGQATTDGDIGMAPYLDNPTVSDSLINFFQTQTVTHNLQSNESTDITSLTLQVVNSSTTLKAAEADSSPDTTYTQQLIDFSTNPAPNTNVRYNYTKWTDDGEDHFRFSTGSLNADSTGRGPKTSNFNLTDVIQCNNFNNFDSQSLYNRGHFTDENGNIDDVDGNDYTVTTGVAFDLKYRVSGDATNQFSNDTWDLNSTGGWKRRTQVPSSASSGFNLTGRSYDMYFEINADSDSNEKMSCVYSNVFSVSNMLQVSSTSSSINNNTIVNGTPARHQRGEAVNWSAFIFYANGSSHASESGISVWFQDNTSVPQASISTESIGANGFIDVVRDISTTATAASTYLGTPYFVSLRDSFDNHISFNNGWNGTANSTFNVSSWYLLNLHCETDSTRTDASSASTFPLPNETGEIQSAIIASDVVFCWNEVRNTRNESLPSVTTTFRVWRSDNTSGATPEDQTTGNDGWTSTYFDKAVEAPSGIWTFGGNISLNGNTGAENESIESISPYTGNLGKVCFIKERAGSDVPKNTWSINSNVTIRCEFRKLQTRSDTDSNDTKFNLVRINRDGTQTTVLENVSMNRVDIGTYDFNITLNSTNGIENNRTYLVLAIAKIDSRDVLSEGIFYILKPQEEIDPKTGWCTPTVQRNQNITCSLELSYLNGTPLAGQTPTIEVTWPNGTSYVASMTELGFGGYRYRHNATLLGSYDIRMNNTLDGINYAAYRSVEVQNHFGLSDGQNKTLYDIQSTVDGIKNMSDLIKSKIDRLTEFQQSLLYLITDAVGAKRPDELVEEAEFPGMTGNVASKLKDESERSAQIYESAIMLVSNLPYAAVAMALCVGAVVVSKRKKRLDYNPGMKFRWNGRSLVDFRA